MFKHITESYNKISDIYFQQGGRGIKITDPNYDINIQYSGRRRRNFHSDKYFFLYSREMSAFLKRKMNFNFTQPSFRKISKFSKRFVHAVAITIYEWIRWNFWLPMIQSWATVATARLFLALDKIAYNFDMS